MQESARPYVLDAVDRAKDWSDLHERLAAHGVIVKLVRRGERVQGLAFAEGLHRNAPGCAASRIDRRCALRSMESRFGPFQSEAQQRPEHASEQQHQSDPHNRSKLRERAERNACDDLRWALRDAERIVDHARLRSEYAQYRDRFFAERHRGAGERRDVAWKREQMQRRCEAQRRREARLLLRTAARLAARGAVTRQLAYWSIDVRTGRRRAHEHQTARVRWEATKIVLASEQRLADEKKPMNYRSFVTERAGGGDASARRVLEALTPVRRPRVEPQRESRPVVLNEAQRHLELIRAEEQAHYEHARRQREVLQRVVEPAKLDEVLAAERKQIEKQVANSMQFTEAQRVRLAQIADRKRSWNPITRAAASREEQALRASRQLRLDAAATEAMREFEKHDVPRITQQVAGEGHRYRQWVTQSLAFEAQMREARELLRTRIPQVERQLRVLQLAGTSHIDLDGDAPRSGLNDLAVAVDRQYRVLPETLRREVELRIRREQRDRSFSRDMTIGR